MNLLQALLALTGASLGFTEEEARALHRQLWRVVLLFIGVVLICFGLNVLGYMLPSVTMTIVYAILVVWAWTHPWSLLALLGVSWLRTAGTNNRIFAEVTAAISGGWYFAVLKGVLFGGTFVLLMLGTVPFARNASAFFVIIAALIFLGVMILIWPKVFSGNAGKKIAYGYAVLVVVYSFATLVFGSVWAKLGFEPGELAATETEKLLLDIKRAKAEGKDKKESHALKSILEKVKADIPLTPEEKGFLEAKESRGASPATTPAATRAAVLKYNTILAPANYLSVKGALADPKFGSCSPQAMVRVVPYVPQKNGPPARGEPFRDGPGVTSHHSFPAGTVFRFQSLTGQDVPVNCSMQVVEVG